MAGFKELRLILVTPETTLLDEVVDGLRLPLYDGQVGILPGRAPVVGRLGYGELHVTVAGSERSYYIDGGFIQVKDGAVSVLTNRAILAGEIDREEAQQLLDDAQERPAVSDAEFEAKARDQQRARGMLAVSSRAKRKEAAL